MNGVGVACAAAAAGVCGVACAGHWATEVVSYDAGATAVPGYTDASAAVGAFERFTGESLGFPSVVSPFSPAFGTEEIVSIGEGGHLTLRLGEAAVDRPGHAFGIDLILFGNGGFIDAGFGGGVPGTVGGAFGFDGVEVEVSADGVSFVGLGSVTEGRLPAMGWLDGGAFDATPGTRATDPRRAMDPSLGAADFAGMTLGQIRAVYGTSAGGTGIDLAGSGLAEVWFVRFSVPDDGNALTNRNAEIDAIAVVPGAGGGVVVALGAVVLGARRRR